MIGLFKKLFSKPASPPPAATPMTEKPASAARPAPTPTPVAAAPLASHPSSRLAPTLTGDMIGLPLSEILARLPNEIAAKVLSRPDVIFSLSASDAVEQLRTGAVRIPFAQLRQGSPAGTFANNATHDDSLIDLPLPLILAAIGPAGLTRRPDQKRTAVPDEVPGVFGAIHSPSSRPAVAAASAMSAAQPATSKPVAPVLPKSVTPIALPTVAPKPTTSLASGLAAPKTPATAPVPIPFAMPKASSPLPFASARPTPKPTPPPTAPAPSGGTVAITLEAVSALWPAAVRSEIQRFNLEIASISIPVNRLEPGMKTGRVVFTWAEVGGWLSAPMPPSAHGESQVELPLRVIAPLFLAQHRATAPRKTVMSVDQSLPDLFTGMGRPVASMPEPVTAPVVAPAPTPVAAPNVFGEIFGLPSKTEWTPQEIAQRILSLPGVAGALLASSDGLLVAGQMPAPLKAETMAAFLPRMFRDLERGAEEAQLGTLRALRLSAGRPPCVICQAGTLYLAVLGQPGQTLPEAAFERIAAALAQQNH